MKVSVFYSWQSELPEDTNRYLIRDAIKDSMGVLKNDYGLIEIPRIDHDTKGTPGRPDIVKTIFSKIEASHAFIADVSFTSKSETGRLCANANVLIELGYAMHSLGDERLILVMNDVFGSPKEYMPFNLAARRWPITFTVSQNANTKERQQTRKDLTSKLVIALKNMADSGVLFSHPITTSSLKSDRLLFSKLLEQFPPNGEIVYFLREHDLGNSIQDKLLNQIENLIREWDDSLHNFIDFTLEDKRLDLFEQLTQFFYEYCSNIYPHPLRSEHYMKLGNLKDDQSGWKKREELNEKATEIYRKHQELIQMCKIKLGFPEGW